MARSKKTRPRRSHTGRIVLLIAVLSVVVLCSAVLALAGRFGSERQPRLVTLSVAYSPEKRAVFEQLAQAFNEGGPRLPNGKRVQLVVASLTPEEMVEVAGDNTHQAISPDSSIWLAEIDRRWREDQGADVDLVGETTRYMISPVVIAMWKDVAVTLGYPQKELGWRDLLRVADENPSFKWSHPSTSTASGLLATLAEFYAGAGLTRGLTEEAATAKATTDYVARLERTVKHYGEGELAVMQRIEEEGQSFLDAFVVQEQMIVQHNARDNGQLVAIYPVEGTLWEDHPLALLEHPQRTDEERLAYQLLKEFVLSQGTQELVLRHGYRPTDLSIPLDHPDSPIRPDNGADPTKPYTTLQIPSPSVIAVVKNVWWYTKRHTNVYLVVDVSGSMEGRKLEDTRAALHAFLGQIEGDLERVGLITFSSRVSEVVPLVELGEGRDGLERAVDRLVAGGNTALLDGVDLALVKLVDLGDRERINALVVMTDGKENRSSTALRTLTSKLPLASPPVVVFCIAYGRDADYGMLESISGASGGFTRRGELESIKDLYKTLSTYF